MEAYKHSFAKVWLAYLGNEILINGKNFFNNNLENIQDKFEIKPLKTQIVLGEDLLDEKELAEVTTISYPDMKQKLGLVIYRVRTSDKLRGWNKRQQYIYYITKRKEGKQPVPEGTIRRRNSTGECIIRWDKLNKCVQGVGDDFGTPEGLYGNGNVTPWVPYSAKKKIKVPINVLVRYKSYDEITELLHKKWKGERIVKRQTTVIKELPTAITEEGDLLCIPYDKDYVPKIVQVGKSGAGKSFALNSILGRAFYIFQDKCMLLNDSLNQFYDLMLPMESKGLVDELWRVGNEPRHLPTINLYMSCPFLKKQYIKYLSEDVGYRLVVGFSEFLNRYNFFTKGIGKWDLGKPEKYLTKEVIRGLNQCRTVNDVKDTLYSMIRNAENDKGIQSMIYKWMSAFENIFRDKFTSNLFTDEETTAPQWTLKTSDGETYKGHPAIISAYAGAIPVVNNSLAKEFPIASKQLADTIRKVPRWQTQMDAIKKKKRIWVFIDELKDLLGRRGDTVYDALDYLFSQGRFPKIGFCGNLQEYTKMSKSMRNSTTHLLVFDLGSKAERKMIADDYQCKEQMDNIGDLKKYQCYFTTKERMVIYTIDGIEKVKKAGEGGMWKCRILPPISVHKSPSD